jgi:hypothetical protein
MIDLQTEELLSLRDAAKRIPPGRRGKRAHLSTVLRWITIGVKGPKSENVKLEGIRLGSRWLTSSEALQRFADRLTPRLDHPSPTIRSTEIRLRSSRRAEHELTKLGF